MSDTTLLTLHLRLSFFEVALLPLKYSYLYMWDQTMTQLRFTKHILEE